ncbi:hypothetical protein F5146DRAFT_223929 [Armillaria mellea]|nr:hypothetical protein F5146DRAFT_223929 [Armillaria mellea]
MPMHTTSEETPSRVGFGPEHPHPNLSPVIPPPDSSVSPQLSSDSLQADLFTFDHVPYNRPQTRMMWSCPPELSGKPLTEHKVADFDPLYMIGDYPSSTGPLLNASSRSKRKRVTPVGSSPVKKARPIDENQGDEAISDTFLDKTRSDLGHSVNIRVNNLVKEVTEVLSKSNVLDQLRDMISVEEAQCILDFLQDMYLEYHRYPSALFSKPLSG